MAVVSRGPKWWRRRRARRAWRDGFPASWTAILRRRLDRWERLDDLERQRMQRLVVTFVHEMRWESARGFELDEETQVVVAAYACLLLLGLDVDRFESVTSIVLHRGTIRSTHPGGVGGGVVAARRSMSGLAQMHGPVVLSWADVDRQTRAGGGRRNVVLHEFAHQLDMLDGLVDGTPPLPDEAARERWVRVCTDAYERLRRGHVSPGLRTYGAVNPGEFFAVATEAFFGSPVELREHEPELYRELRAFYGQDPSVGLELGPV